MTKRVWILGAGFSRALGGPLLNDLLSVRSRYRLLARWPEKFDEMSGDRALFQVYALYHYGRGFPEGCPLKPWRNGRSFSGELLWENAEDFLVQLDDGSEDNVRRFKAIANRAISAFGHINDNRGPKLDQLSPTKRLVQEARRIIAAECEIFIDERQAAESASWASFRRWGRFLGGEDTVVSFNYDRVVELVRRGLDQPCLRETPRRGNPMLCKMHGSVDWGIDKGEKVTQYGGSMEHRLRNEAYEPCIGIPGQGKDQLAGGVLAPSWGHSEVALREAKEVYLIGYSLPPSDAMPRTWLLDALRENDSEHIKVRVVLGRDKAAIERLKSLILYTLPDRTQGEEKPGVRTLDLDAPPLFAQDFLDTLAA